MPLTACIVLSNPEMSKICLFTEIKLHHWKTCVDRSLHDLFIVFSFRARQGFVFDVQTFSPFNDSYYRSYLERAIIIKHTLLKISNDECGNVQAIIVLYSSASGGKKCHLQCG